MFSQVNTVLIKLARLVTLIIILGHDRPQQYRLMKRQFLSAKGDNRKILGIQSPSINAHPRRTATASLEADIVATDAIYRTSRVCK